jgi:hypothetical protein
MKTDKKLRTQMELEITPLFMRLANNITHAEKVPAQNFGLRRQAFDWRDAAVV